MTEAEIVLLLRQRRHELGLSAKALAKRAGVCDDNLRKIEMMRHSPSMPILLAVCEALGLELQIVAKPD